MGLVAVAKEQGAKIVFTLHDFWLACPRGQFLQWGLSADKPFAACDGQCDSKCASKCFNRTTTGVSDSAAVDIAYQTNWVAKRMECAKQVCQKVDLFLSPSEHLANRMCKELTEVTLIALITLITLITC